MSMNLIDAARQASDVGITSLKQGAVAMESRQVGPWPGIPLTTHDIANFFAVFGGSGMGIIAASRQERLSTAAAIVGLGFPVVCFVWGFAANNPELLQGGTIELVSFVAGYFGMALSRRMR